MDHACLVNGTADLKQGLEYMANCCPQNAILLYSRKPDLGGASRESRHRQTHGILNVAHQRSRTDPPRKMIATVQLKPADALTRMRPFEVFWFS